MYNVHFTLAELNEVLDKNGQGQRRSPRRILETADTSGDESDFNVSRPEFLFKKTFKLKISQGADEFVKFFITGTKNAVNKLSHISCRICRKGICMENMSFCVTNNGLVFFLVTSGCAYRRMGWRVNSYQVNSVTEDASEQQNYKI